MPKSVISASSLPPTMMFAGFEIAMHDTGRVRRDEARRYLPRDRNARRTSRGPSRASRSARSVPSTYDIVMYLTAVDLAEIVNAHDIGVRHEPREQQLALEPALDRRRGVRRRHELAANQLDRHVDAELGIPGLVHGAHAAEPERSLDVVALAERLHRPTAGPTRRARGTFARGLTDGPVARLRGRRGARFGWARHGGRRRRGRLGESRAARGARDGKQRQLAAARTTTRGHIYGGLLYTAPPA